MTPPLFAFEVSLHARPEAATPGPSYADAWGVWPTLQVPGESLSAPMAIGFDDLLEQLAAIERLYVEPDGSFVWASSRDQSAPPRRPWQVDGNAYDRGGRVVLVDLKGSCPAGEFDRLLTACGWPEQLVMLQLVRAAVFLDEATFRRHAAARGAVGDGETLRPS